MAKIQPFQIVYDSELKDHFAVIEAKYHSLIRTTIVDQLQFEPNKKTRNRKPLVQPAAFDADWELRFGPNNRFRVLYAVDEEQREVQILAVGLKDRNRFTVGGKEIKL